MFMRIIAGSLGGRTFNAPHGHKTHPMSDKMRGALFNVLGDISGLTVLDIFAGSGALSIEAISRGAASAVAIDTDRAAHRVIEENVANLQLSDKIKVIRANAGGWSIHNMEKKFDILLMDPPYDHLKLDSLQIFIKRHLKPTGVAVLSFPGHKALPEFAGAKLVSHKNYGDAQLAFYKHV
jgi:16S rRNA (guanine966-N2)-methyltransferase